MIFYASPGANPALRIFALLVLGAGLVSPLAAHASEIRALVKNSAGAPLADAVVYAEPARGGGQVKTPKEVLIEQIDKTFVPEISVVQTGTAINFPNRDSVRHHVYSFSPAKVFEIKLFSGVPAKPVIFDKPGEVVIGCNIHDQMIAHILIVDTPYFAKAGKNGEVVLSGLPAGDYTLKAWHPAAQTGSESLSIAASGSRTVQFKLSPKAVGQPRR